MKILVHLFVLSAASLLTARAQEVIHPVVAPEFGRQVSVRTEFVAKGNDYHAPNIVSEPYTLKVVAVNGLGLKEPVLIEYHLHVAEQMRAKIEQPGVVSTFEAYETLYQPGMATAWLPEGEQGTGFALVHVLHIRPPQKKG